MGPRPRPQAARQGNAQATAFCVCLADGKTEGIPNSPGHLYFYLNPDHLGAVPKAEEAARRELENFCSVMRIALQRSQPDMFKDHFERVFSVAKAVFAPEGFRSEPLGDLANFKKEIVQQAGGQIKSAYLRRMLIWCGGAAAIFYVAALVLHVVGWSLAGKGWLPVDKVPVEVSPLHTGILMACSMVGLYFATCLRNLTPTFETLAVPDADLARPWVRVTFYAIAVLVLALVFQLEIVSVSIGPVFSTANIPDSVAVAALWGLFLGIAERALPNEVLRWTDEALTRSGREQKGDNPTPS